VLVAVADVAELESRVETAVDGADRDLAGHALRAEPNRLLRAERGRRQDDDRDDDEADGYRAHGEQGDEGLAKRPVHLRSQVRAEAQVKLGRPIRTVQR